MPWMISITEYFKAIQNIYSFKKVMHKNSKNSLSQKSYYLVLKDIYLKGTQQVAYKKAQDDNKLVNENTCFYSLQSETVIKSLNLLSQAGM